MIKFNGIDSCKFREYNSIQLDKLDTAIHLKLDVAMHFLATSLPKYSTSL